MEEEIEDLEFINKCLSILHFIIHVVIIMFNTFLNLHSTLSSLFIVIHMLSLVKS